MKLKKIFLMMMTCILTAAIFTGCGEEEKSDSEKFSVKIGVLKYTNISEQQFTKLQAKIAETLSLRVIPHKVVFFDNLNSMQMALSSGQIDEVSTYDCVADYLVARTASVSVLQDHTIDFSDDFCLAMRENNEKFYNQVNDVVKAMKDDGTLAKFEKKYITDLKPGDEPEAVEIEKFEGADTINVAITGDLPPIDLILADGKPAGFNTAVLSEIGKRLHKNIELVQVESGARAAALTSGRVDISFWAILPISNIIPANVDRPDGIILSTPYYRGKVVHVGWDIANANSSADLKTVTKDLSK